jgi:arylsulfatase A-like enzyme
MCFDKYRKSLALSALLISAPVYVLAQDAGHFPSEPDILFISIDDLNDWVGPLDGYPRPKTPNLDRLAAQGMTFTNAHAPGTYCNPSRTALMTGVRPSTSGVYVNQSDWRLVERLKGIPTLPRYFRDNGYRTYGAGKLFHSSTFRPWAFSGYNDTTAWEAYFPSLERQLPDEVGPPTRPANGNPYSPNFDWSAVVATDMAMGDGQVVTWSVNKILAEGDAPRFNAIGIYRPHLPWYVPQEYLDMHPLEDIVLPPVDEHDLDDIPEYPLQGGFTGDLPPRGLHQWIVEDAEKDRWRQGVQAYLASISFADAMLGHLLDALEQSGRAKNTIIVLWSDHGWHLGEKARWRKETLWRESTRVPVIVVAPGVTLAGSRSATPVSLMDLYPTIVELADMKVPPHVEGTSLVPILKDPATSSGRAVVSTHGFGNHAVSGDQYRYIRYSDGSEELYDINSDPHEWKNLAGDPAHATTKERLAQWLPKHDEPSVGENRE